MLRRLVQEEVEPLVPSVDLLQEVEEDLNVERIVLPEICLPRMSIAPKMIVPPESSKIFVIGLTFRSPLSNEYIGLGTCVWRPSRRLRLRRGRAGRGSP